MHHPWRPGALLHKLTGLVLAGCLGFLVPGHLVAQTGEPETTDESRLDALEREVAALRAAVTALTASPEAEDATPAVDPATVEELARRIEILAAELEAFRLGEATAQADASEHGYGPAASKVYHSQPGISIGGYGELLYENFDGTRDDGVESGRTDQFDMLRAVFYFGYKFGDNWLFNSEIELEHGGDEVAIEFAYLDRLWKPGLNFRVGHLLTPMGFVNELHEPPVFLGTTRPVTERVILPSTWHENGFGLFGEVGQLSYRTYLLNGMDASGFSAAGLRGGRQKGARAVAEDFAWTGRVDYAPAPGLLLGGSVYLGSSGQGVEDSTGRRVAVGTSIYEGHAEWRWRGLELRGLVARAELDDVARLNDALGLTRARGVGETMEGSYLQVGYDVLTHFDAGGRQLTPYLRWEQVDTHVAVPRGFLTDPARDQEILTLGLEYQPIPQIVLKGDYQDVDNAADTGIDQFNVSVGYIF